MFLVTREFVSGPLKGLTHTEVTSVAWKVGTLVRKPIGGSAYKIIRMETSG